MKTSARQPQTANEQLDLVSRAQEIAGSGTINELLNQADSVLNRLVGSHRSGTMTDRDAAIGVALISELRSAADKALRVVSRGTLAGQVLTSPTGANNA